MHHCQNSEAKCRPAHLDRRRGLHLGWEEGCRPDHLDRRRGLRLGWEEGRRLAHLDRRRDRHFGWEVKYHLDYPAARLRFPFVRPETDHI